MGGRTSNWRKEDEELGMSIATASNRLRKRLLFELVKKLGQNFCYRCSAEIETAEELTVDHMQEWRGVDPKLFWDLDNCAWAHPGCNSAASRKPTQHVPTVEGTAWCWSCKDFRPTEEFYVNRRRWNGLTSQCKTCYKEYLAARPEYNERRNAKRRKRTDSQTD